MRWSAWGFTKEDVEWRRSLRQRLDLNEDAKSWWIDLYQLRYHPDLDEIGQGVLERLSAEE